MTRSSSWIPFNRPFIAGRELFYIAQAVVDGHLAGDGMFTARCHRWLEQHYRGSRVLLTHSCTAALEMAAILCNVGPGDEVIVPSYTFVSTANAFALRGASITFADIRPDTLNIDESRIAELITERTKAIVPVHYAGVGAEMDAIINLAQREGVAVIEDAAQAIAGRYRGRNLGTLGDLGAISFHETKNVISGEGGAIIINKPELVERAEIIREKGTNRSRFFRGEVDKYTWIDLGSSFLPSELVAAFLFAQLEEMELLQQRWRDLWTAYESALADWATAHGARTPYTPAHCEQPFHMFYLLMPTAATQARLIRHLADRNIHAVFHYLPLHLSDMGRKVASRPTNCPVTEDVSGRLVRLPFFNNMSDDEHQRVVEAVLEFQP